VISISAGQRGVQLLMTPDTYLRAVKAVVGPIAKEKE
jgi:Cys-tRNA(Pro)/Cys-tRNA(Cys) deacylase